MTHNDRATRLWNAKFSAQVATQFPTDAVIAEPSRTAVLWRTLVSKAVYSVHASDFGLTKQRVRSIAMPLRQAMHA